MSDVIYREALDLRAKIARKLSKLSSELAYVQKDGKVERMGYNYLTASSLAQKINAGLVRNGLAVTGTTMKVTEHGKTATVHVRLEVCDVETGFVVYLEGVSSGTDNGDKGTSKAVTVTAKYAWLIALSIGTGDDTENVVSMRQSAKAFLEYDLPTKTTLAEAAALYVASEEHWQGLTEKERDRVRSHFVFYCRTKLSAEKPTPDDVKEAVHAAREARESEES